MLLGIIVVLVNWSAISMARIAGLQKCFSFSEKKLLIISPLCWTIVAIVSPQEHGFLILFLILILHRSFWDRLLSKLSKSGESLCIGTDSGRVGGGVKTFWASVRGTKVLSRDIAKHAVVLEIRTFQKVLIELGIVCADDGGEAMLEL